MSLYRVSKLLQPSFSPTHPWIKFYSRNHFIFSKKTFPVSFVPRLQAKGTAASAILLGGGVSALCFVTWKRWSAAGSGNVFVVKAESNVDVAETGESLSPFVAECAATGRGKKRRKSTGDNESISTLATSGGADDDEDVEFDWKQFGEILRPYWVYLTISVASAVAVAVINIEIPHVLGQIVDVVTTKLLFCAGNGTNDINFGSSINGSSSAVSGISPRTETFEFLVKGPATKLLSLYLLQAGFTFSYIYSLSVVGEGVASELRRRLFSSLLHQPIAWWDKQMTGQVVGRLSSDVQEFKSSFKAVISQGLRSLSQAFGCVVSLLLISPAMTQTIVAVVPVIILVGSVFGRGLRALSKRAQEQVAVSNGHAEEALANIRTVRAFSMEKEEEMKYSKALDDGENLNVQLGVGIGAFQGGSTLFLNGLVLAVLYTGGQLISTHSITSGELMSFLVAAQTIQKSLANLSLLFGQCVRGLGAGARVFEYINLPQENNSGGAGEVLEEITGDLEFHNVWFKYPTRMDGDYILKRFSLRLPRGKVVAVVGASGCGKSTLVNLLELFYPCEKGEITLDSVRLDSLDSGWVRGSVFGLISQEPTLFAASIKENIRYGKPSATDEEVYEAARQANAYSFIMDMPAGFDTRVGERGVTVSGGQKQRIAIARALIKDPKVLILDEATSALDSESEAVVQATLEKVQKGRTVLVIAHRLSTVQNADIIAVVEDGKIAELGTHTELKKKKGLYYNFVKTQEYKAKAFHK